MDDNIVDEAEDGPLTDAELAQIIADADDYPTGFVTMARELRALRLRSAAPSDRDVVRAALEEIRDAHLGDCPAAMPELAHAHMHIGYLRRLADAALKTASSTGEKP